MIKNILTLLVLLVFCLTSIAQSEIEELLPDENFLYLNDKTLLREGEYTTKKNFFQHQFRYANGEKISFRDVSFYQNDDGYFAMNPGKTIFGQKTYDPIKRIEAGKIDLFIKFTDSYDGRTHSKSTSYYYSKGFEGVNSINYKNLKRDLILSSDEDLKIHNELILSLLEKGKKNKKISRTLLWTGLGTFIAGIGLTEAGKNNGSVKLLGNVTAGIGFGSLITSLIIQSKPSYLSAIREYNKFY